MIYNWQQSDWPNFRYDLKDIEDVLFSFAERAGRVAGLLEGLPEDNKTEAMIDIMVAEAIKTSEIEGEYLIKSCKGDTIGIGIVNEENRLKSRKRLS